MEPPRSPCFKDTTLGLAPPSANPRFAPETKKQIKNMVKSIARDKGVLRKDGISDGWFRGFMERQLKLRLHNGDKTTFV